MRFAFLVVAFALTSLNVHSAQSPLDRYTRDYLGFDLGHIPFGASAKQFPGLELTPSPACQAPTVQWLKPKELGLGDVLPESVEIGFRSNQVAVVRYTKFGFNEAGRTDLRQKLEAFEKLGARNISQNQLEYANEAFTMQYHGDCNLRDNHIHTQVTIEPRAVGGKDRTND